MTANIRSVSEDDFTALAWAANEAHRLGNSKIAKSLDVMARKANAALSRAKYQDLEVYTPNPRPFRWNEVPSVLSTLTEPTK